MTQTAKYSYVIDCCSLRYIFLYRTQKTGLGVVWGRTVVYLLRDPITKKVFVKICMHVRIYYFVDIFFRIQTANFYVLYLKVL